MAAKAEIPKGKLKLAPMTMLVNLSLEKKSSSTPAINVGGVKVFATAPPAATKIDMCDKCLFIPYWWVKESSDENMVNMRLAAVKEDGITIPILQNTRKIEVHERLYVLKDKVVKDKLKDAKVEPLQQPDPPKKRKMTQ